MRFLIFLAAISFSQILSRAALIKSSILEKNVAYFHIGEMDDDLPQQIQSAQGDLAATNKIAGTVLDLRFAGGDGLDSEKAIVNLFAQNKLPLAILVNGETSGAAVQLAKDLREAKAGLIFGSARELQPDISVSMKAADEKKFLANPYGTISTNEMFSAETNDFLPAIDHTTEADLVRAKIKDGDQDETISRQSAAQSQKPFIRDPALARGVDFIEAEAIVRLSRS